MTHHFRVLIELPWTVESDFDCVSNVSELSFEGRWKLRWQCTSEWVSVSSGRQLGLARVGPAQQIVRDLEVFFMPSHVFSLFFGLAFLALALLSLSPLRLRLTQKSNLNPCKTKTNEQQVKIPSPSRHR